MVVVLGHLASDGFGRSVRTRTCSKNDRVLSGRLQNIVNASNENDWLLPTEYPVQLPGRHFFDEEFPQ